MTNRQTIEIQHTEGLSRDELETQKARYYAVGWTEVSFRMRPDLAGSGWKAYEWTGVRPPVQARTYVQDIGVPDYDPTSEDIEQILKTDHGYEDVKVLWWSAPVADEEAYVLHDVEIEGGYVLSGEVSHG